MVKYKSLCVITANYVEFLADSSTPCDSLYNSEYVTSHSLPPTFKRCLYCEKTVRKMYYKVLRKYITKYNLPNGVIQTPLAHRR